MKKFILPAVLIIAAIMYSCDSNTADSIIDGGGDSGKVVKDYFPGGVGSNWTYAVGLSDSGSTAYSNNATKAVTFKSVVTTDGADEINQEEAVVYNGNALPVSIVKMRRSDKGLYILIDTTGLAESIPDTVKQLLNEYLGSFQLNISTEVQTLSVPFFSGQTWKAFALNISSGVIFSVDAIVVNASYAGTENIDIQSETKQAQKIKYTVIFRYPSESVIPFNEKSYDAFAWYVEGVGLAKFQGNALITNVLSGSEINLSDTNRVAVQTLTSYEIK